MSTPLGYQVGPSPSTFGGTIFSTSPYDIASITAAIDRAAASLKPNERGAATIRVDKGGIGGGLVVRGPLNTELLATIVKPMASAGFDWSVSGRIAFAVGQEPKAVRWFPELRGLYRMLRSWNGRAAAARKALEMSLGLQVRLGS